MGADLADQGRGEKTAAGRAGRLEPAGRQVIREARAGCHRTVLDAQAEALAVDHHRAGERQPGDAHAGHGGQQHGRPMVVRVGVVGQVLHVHPEPDLGREVAHPVDSSERRLDRGAVAHVPDDQRRVERSNRTPVDVRAQRVEHQHVVAAGEQHVQHGPADEPGAAGEQHPHRSAAVHRRRVGNAGRARAIALARPEAAAGSPRAGRAAAGCSRRTARAPRRG